MADLSLKDVNNKTATDEYATLRGAKQQKRKKYYRKIYVIVFIFIIMLIIAIVVTVNALKSPTSKPFRSGPPADNPTLPYWLQNAPFQNVSTGDSPKDVDITIIGAGISGTSILYHLVKYLNENTSVNTTTNILLLDARGASGGATGRNGGIMGILGAEPFNSTLTEFGEETALLLYNFTKQNLNDTMRFIEDKKIEANLKLAPLILAMISNDSSHLQSIQNAINMMKNNYNIGFENKLLNTAQMRNMSESDIWTNGIYSNVSYSFWPSRVVFGLLNYSILHTNNTLNAFESRTNLNIQFNKLVTSVTFNEINESWNIKTRDNKRINSNIIIYATNGYTSYLLPEYSSKIYPAKNQVIISKILNESVWRQVGVIGDDYEYYNQLLDGRLLIGGGRQKAPNNWINNYDDSDIDGKVEEYLEDYLYEYYPHIQEKRYMDDWYMEWQGIMGFTDDGWPYIGPLVNKHNAYICAGYTGSGMQYAFLAGKAIASMIMNRQPTPFVDAFLPSSRS